MRLVRISDHATVVDFGAENDTPQFTQPQMTKYFMDKGIVNPHQPKMESLFHGKEVVRLADPEFYEVFRNVYCPLSLNKYDNTYAWEESVSLE